MRKAEVITVHTTFQVSKVQTQFVIYESESMNHRTGKLNFSREIFEWLPLQSYNSCNLFSEFFQ